MLVKQNFFILFVYLFSAISLPEIYGLEDSSSKTIPKKNTEEPIVLFTPPQGWHLTDPTTLTPHVRCMVVGKGTSSFPPSLNLSSEPYKGTLREFLKIVKNINTSKGDEWKDLGTIKTKAGLASLSQVDTPTPWGEKRLMHVIIVKEGQVYILTASALKSEFPSFYNAFFASMKSLNIVKDPYDLIANLEDKKLLRKAADHIVEKWKEIASKTQIENPQMSSEELHTQVFAKAEFQNSVWIPFTESLKQKYSDLGPEWQSLFLQKLKNRL